MRVGNASQPEPTVAASDPGRDVSPAPAGGADESLFRTLVEAGRCMIAILRLDRTVAYLNAFGEELTGYTAEEALGADYFERFVPKSVRAEVESHFARAFGSEAGVEIEHPLLAKGNTIRWVVCSFRSLRDYAGGPAVVLTAQDISIHKRTEETLRRRTHDLGERVKELNCLFGLSRLDEEPAITLDGVLQGLADILPPAWQYPDTTCARIVFEGREFRTFNYRRTEWRQAAPISAHGQPAGQIEVYYLEEKPAAYEGPFLVEERRLIDALAQRLGRIAERIRAQEELRRERDFAESLIETAPAIILVLDPAGRVVRVNPYMEEVSGYRLEEVRGKDWFRTFLPPRNRKRMRALVAGTIDDRQRFGAAGPLVTKDGRERQIEWQGKVLVDARDEVIGLLAIGQDITERTKLEKEVADISTREQQRIGQELHDGLGQELTGLGYLAATLCCDLQEHGAAEADMANQLADGVERALEKTRAIAQGLVPVEIDAAGLLAALEQLAAEAQARCGVACRFVCDGPPAFEDTAKAAQLFRIVQEAVNNAARHARATRITVEVKAGADQAVFEVTDDGMGISSANETAGGMGLRIMHYRAGVIGALLSVGPAPGGGTLVRCVLPQDDGWENEIAEPSDGPQA